MSESHPVRGDSEQTPAPSWLPARNRLEQSLSLGISAVPDPPSRSPVSSLLFYPAAAPRLSGILCVLVGVRPRVPRSGAAAAALAGV